jgi:hypothetical protein
MGDKNEKCVLKNTIPNSVPNNTPAILMSSIRPETVIKSRISYNDNGRVSGLAYSDNSPVKIEKRNKKNDIYTL